MREKCVRENVCAGPVRLTWSQIVTTLQSAANLEVTEQRWLAAIVVGARPNCEAFALGSCRLLVLADVLQVENDTTGTLGGTLV